MSRRTRLGRLLDTELHELLRLVQEHDLAELEVYQNGLRLHLSRDPSGRLEVSQESAALSDTEVVAAELSDALLWLRAPVIGRFYFESPLTSGQLLPAGQRLGHIDTLDLITEVATEAATEVVDILVEEGQGVEYGQPLFALRPQ